MSKSALAAGLESAVARANGKTQTPTAKLKAATVTPEADATEKPPSELVLIGAHYPVEVRSALLLVQADPQNVRKNFKQLLGEAINLLCAKYGKPQPYGDR
jgi:hypothetical protein